LVFNGVGGIGIAVARDANRTQFVHGLSMVLVPRWLIIVLTILQGGNIAEYNAGWLCWD
jgi:hypothetical protein